MCRKWQTVAEPWKKGSKERGANDDHYIQTSSTRWLTRRRPVIRWQKGRTEWLKGNRTKVEAKRVVKRDEGGLEETLEERNGGDRYKMSV